MDEDVPIVEEDENDTDDNVDEEVEAIDDGSEDASHDGLLDEDDDNVDDDDGDDFTESMFMQCKSMTSLHAVCVFMTWTLCYVRQIYANCTGIFCYCMLCYVCNMHSYRNAY